MRQTSIQVMAIASLFLMASVLATEAPPADATLTVHIVSIAVGVGYSWGGGIVTFQGHVYPCRIDGLAVGEGGISSAEAIGTVSHLTRIEDISGQYTAVSAGALLTDGDDVVTLQNPHKMVIDLTAISQGAKIMRAMQGVTIAVVGVPTASTGP